jgi:hypothetical protein
MSWTFLHGQDHVKKRIFILHSYSQEYTWTKLENDSFVSKLEEISPFPLEISVEYLDTKRLKYSSEYQSFFSSYLSQKYKGYTPDAIYVSDDNALTLFLNPNRLLFQNVPVFFSGINDLSLAKTIDPQKYTGVFETSDIVPNIELIRGFSPQTREVWIVGDDSTTYHSIETDIRNHIGQYPKDTFHFIVSSRIDDIIAKLPNRRKSFVLLTTIGGLNDENGHNLTLKESIGRLKQNPQLILCSMEDAYVIGGVVGGFVTSGMSQGEHAAKMVSRYLNGEPLNHIHSIEKSPNIYMFDRKALTASRLILSEYIARNAIIVNENKTFFEKYQQVILNFMFIGLILFLVVLVAVYFLIAHKKAQIEQLSEKLDACDSEILRLNEKHSNIDTNDE